jgi:Guanine nucleotide exchange factor synembryn
MVRTFVGLYASWNFRNCAVNGECLVRSEDFSLCCFVKCTLNSDHHVAVFCWYISVFRHAPAFPSYGIVQWHQVRISVGIINEHQVCVDLLSTWSLNYRCHVPCVIFCLLHLCRPKLRQELHGLTYLIEVLDLTLRSADEAARPVTDQEVDLCCEVLKILFNVTVGSESNSLDEASWQFFSNVCTCTANKRSAACLLNHKPCEIYRA